MSVALETYAPSRFHAILKPSTPISSSMNSRSTDPRTETRTTWSVLERMTMPTIRFKSWELIDKEADLEKLIMEFVGTDQRRAQLIVKALSSLKDVYIRIPREREAEFAEKIEEYGANISD